MTEEIEQVAGSILAMIFGGLILIELAPVLNSTTTINLAAWGVLLLIVAVVSVMAITYGMFKSLTN